MRSNRFESVEIGDILTFAPSLTKKPIYDKRLSYIVVDFVFNKYYLDPLDPISFASPKDNKLLSGGCTRTLDCLRKYWYKHTTQEMAVGEVLYGRK